MTICERTVYSYRACRRARFAVFPTRENIGVGGMTMSAQGTAAGIRRSTICSTRGRRAARGGVNALRRGGSARTAASLGDAEADMTTRRGQKTFTLHAGQTSISIPIQRDVVQVRWHAIELDVMKLRRNFVSCWGTDEGTRLCFV